MERINKDEREAQRLEELSAHGGPAKRESADKKTQDSIKTVDSGKNTGTSQGETGAKLGTAPNE